MPFKHNYKISLPSTKNMILLTKIIRLSMAVSKFNPKLNYYKVLNVSSQATPDQIKKSFKELAKKYHPDVSKGYQQTFKQVNEAYQVLSSPQVRKEYDQSREAPQSRQANPSQYRDPYRQHPYQQQHHSYEEPQQSNYRTEYTQEEFRQHARRQHEELMKKYVQQRQQYRDLGGAYSNYDQFARETLRKKAQQQTDKVTLDSVKRQEELKKRQTQAREQEEFLRKQQELKQKMNEKYHRAFQNGQNIVGGFKRMGEFVKDIFRKK